MAQHTIDSGHPDSGWAQPNSDSRDVDICAFPASFAQQRLWFLDQLQPGAANYNIVSATRVSGELDVTTLAHALRESLRRHEVLRTAFRFVDGNLLQVVRSDIGVPLTVVDLRGFPDLERAAESRRLACEETQRSFDLQSAPLWHVSLQQLGAADHVLVLTMHHIISDAWSVGVFYSELMAVYDAFREGHPAPLPELPIQYADYAVWQRGWMDDAWLASQLAHWRSVLADAPDVLSLPTDRPRPAVQRFRGGRHTFAMSPALTEALHALSNEQNVTLFMTLLAAFQALIARYTEQEDIVVGSPIANRTRVETERLIGFFANTLVFRTNLADDPSFLELLARVRAVALDAYAHQDVPFEKLVEELQPTRSLSQSPLVQVMFVMQNAPLPQATSRYLTLSRVDVPAATAKFDLTLAMSKRGNMLRGTLDYDADLFDEETIRRLVGHFCVLLTGIVADPNQRLSSLSLLSSAENRQLIVEWNSTSRPYPRRQTVHDLFETQAGSTPTAIAAVFGDRTISYGDLNRRANQLARHLRSLGVESETRVGICVTRSVDMLVSLLAILKAGGAYVPLDPSYPQQRLGFIADNADVAVVLTHTALAPRFPNDGWRIICLDRDWPVIGREADGNLPNVTAPDRIAYIMYTSGSTGQPKGVCVTHRNIIRLLFGVDYARLDSKTCMLHLAPLAFDASTFEIWGALLHGGRLVLGPPEIPSFEELERLLRRERVTTVWLTSSLFNTVVDERPQALASVKQLLIGGEVLSVPHVVRAQALLPSTEIINGYGPTEGTTFTCCYPIPRDVDRTGQSIPIGRPIGNTRVYVLDRYHRPTPIGVPGELFIGGDGVARCYLNETRLTNEKFVADPYSTDPESRLYRTGDLVRFRSDGLLEFLGRLDDQVKIRGFRIEPGEVEAVLAEHPSVKQALVIASDDPPDDRRLVAYIVPSTGPLPTAAALRRFAESRLPAHMIPATVVLLDHLPLTASGKVNRAALPKPGRVEGALTTSFVPPRTAIEKRLAELWARALGVERIGVDDNFFDLGGHSLLAVRLFASIEKELNRKLPLAAVFNAPSIAQLATLLEQPLIAARSLVPIQPLGSQLPFFCVHAADGEVLVFAHLARHLGTHQPFFGLQPTELEGTAEGPVAVEVLANHYVETIVAHLPDGPYLLGGYSSGGGIAFEMACQLAEQGRSVGLVALIDTPAVYETRSVAARRVLDYATAQQLDAARRLRFVRAIQAARRYRPRPYRGPVDVFRAARYADSNPLLGWQHFALGGVRVHIVPGDHLSIIREPAVRHLAESLSAAIVKATP